MIRKELVLCSKYGLAGRSVELFTGVASRFASRIDIEGQGKDKLINAKSIMGVLSLMLKQGDSFTIVADGDDAPAAVEALTRLLESDFMIID